MTLLKQKPTPRFAWDWRVLILLLVTCVPLFHALDSPFLGHHDANGLWLGGAGRNLWAYGLGRYSLVPILNRAPITDANPPAYYVNHPPVVVYATALAQRLFGDHDFALRLVSVFASLISLSGFAVMFRRLFGRESGLLALVLYALTPMILYFGRMPDHEPLALAFLSLFLAQWLTWYRGTPGRSRGRLTVLIGLAGLAIWTAWASFFFVAACGLIGLWARRKGQRGQAMLLFLSAPAWVGSVVCVYVLQYPATLAQLVGIFRSRALEMGEYMATVTLTFGDWLGTTILHLVVGATFALLICSLIGLLLIMREPRRDVQRFCLALLGAGVAYIAVFRNVAYLHDYYKIYLMPALAALATYPIGVAWRRRSQQRWLYYGVIILFSASSISAILLARPWYDTGDGAEIRALGYRLRDATTPDDEIISNMRYTTATEYYAFRTIQWNVAPDQAGSRVNPTRTQYYLYCTWADPTLTNIETAPIRDAECTLRSLAAFAR